MGCVEAGDHIGPAPGPPGNDKLDGFVGVGGQGSGCRQKKRKNDQDAQKTSFHISSRMRLRVWGLEPVFSYYKWLSSARHSKSAGKEGEGQVKMRPQLKGVFPLF